MFELIPCIGYNRRLIAESLYDAGLFVEKELGQGHYVTVFPENSPMHIVLENGDVVIASPMSLVETMVNIPGSYAVVNGRSVFHPMMLAMLFQASYDRLAEFVSKSDYEFFIDKPPERKVT